MRARALVFFYISALIDGLEKSSQIGHGLYYHVILNQGTILIPLVLDAPTVLSQQLIFNNSRHSSECQLQAT